MYSSYNKPDTGCNGQAAVLFPFLGAAIKFLFENLQDNWI